MIENLLKLSRPLLRLAEFQICLTAHVVWPEFGWGVVLFRALE